LTWQISDEVEEDVTGAKAYWDEGDVNGAPNKLDEITQYHIGETAHSLSRVSLQPGGTECLVYTTMLGAIGAFVPFGSREDVDFFSHLEMHMRQESWPLCGRDQLSFRSSYFPVKDCVDGDLCEMFTSLPHEKQREIAEELDRTPNEVVKKLEDLRNRIL
jgi:splicing factor 3B subunit 3